MASIEQSMAAYYGARAPEYDLVYRKPERQPDIREIQEWLPPIFAAATVVEVACGTGYWTPFIASRARGIVGLDVSTETLAIARRRLPTNAKLLVADAYRLPFRDRAFDSAFAGFWLSHVPRARLSEFLVVLHRALRPGATVVLLDNLYVEGSNHPVIERDARGDDYQERRLADGSTHRVLKNFPTEAELRAVALSAGARQVEYKTWRYYWALRYEAGERSARWALDQ